MGPKGWTPLHIVQANDVIYYTPHEGEGTSVKDALDGITDLIKEGWTTEQVSTTDRIPVAGTFLAEILNAGGIKEIPSGISLQSLLTEWCAKELWATDVIFHEGNVNASMTPPAFTLSQTGLVEVGSTVTVSAVSVPEVVSSYTERTYSGFAYGYSTKDNDTQESKDTSISVQASGKSAVSGDNYTLTRNINGTV